MNFFRSSSSSRHVNDVVHVLNVLKSNPAMVDDVFQMVMRYTADEGDLHKLIMTLINKSDRAFDKVVRCLGSPHSSRGLFSGWLSGQIQRGELVFRSELNAIKDCYAEVYSSIVNESEKMNLITKWCLEQNRKNSPQLQRLLHFIKASENLPGYKYAPSYEPPNYYSLYTNDYKQLPYGPRAYGGRRKRSKRRSTRRSRKRSVRRH